MAILFENDEGYFICHRQYSEETLGTPYRKVLFDIRTPFLKDLEAASIANTMESGIQKVKKRKRHRQKEIPIEESDVRGFLTKLDFLLSGSPTADDFRSNNKPAREAVKNFLSLTATIQNDKIVSNHRNNEKDATQLQLWNDLFYLPANSQFYRNKIQFLSELVDENQKFSLVIIDPPWTNRFIKRKWGSSSSLPSYCTLENELLANMPIPELCHQETLVAIWCTNSNSHHNYLLDDLLTKWQLQHVATWYWIKVTTFGNLVCSWNGPSGKHPFERIIFAHLKTANSERFRTFPERKWLVSVPCAIHSFKPPLERILKPFIQSGNCLELFARSLLPNTVSWGDQLPLLQHSSLFEQLIS